MTWVMSKHKLRKNIRSAPDDFVKTNVPVTDPCGHAALLLRNDLDIDEVGGF
jgi:hypothetical protein